MLLAVDIGNTNLVIGGFESDKLRFEFRLGTDLHRTSDEYAALISTLVEKKLSEGVSVASVVISSVVPPLTTEISKILEGLYGSTPLIIGPGTKTGIQIKLKDPASVGADRVVNAVALRELYGAPGLVVDFGTATSIDVVDTEGNYRGGVIAPGLGISLESLSANTAKLPRIDIAWPDSVIGTDTVSAMQAGAVVGYVAMIDGLICRIHQELGVKTRVIATGGIGELMTSHSEYIDSYSADLTLQGIRIIAGLNR